MNMRRLLSLVAFFATVQASAQQVNPVPDYVFANRMSAGRNTVTDTAAYFSIGPRYGATRGMMPPMVVDTASFSGNRRNGLLIFSVQKNKFLYWDSVGVKWAEMAGTAGTALTSADTAALLSTRAWRQKGIDSLAAIRIAGSGTTNYVPKFTAGSTIGNSQIFDNGTNVGINTTSPSVKMHIKGTALTGSALRFEPLTSTTIYSQVAGNNGDLILQADPGNAEGSSNISFQVDNNEFVRLNASGDMGIGTTSPSVKLHVKGTAFTKTAIRFEPTTSTSIYSQITGNNGDIQIQSDPLNNEGSSAIKFEIDGSEKMRLTGGEVLINTSTDAGDYKLQVNGAGIFGSGTTDNQVTLAFPQDLKLRYRQSISSAYGFLLDSAHVESLFLTSFEGSNTQALLLMGDGFSKNIFGFSHSTDYGVTYTADFVIEATGIIGIGTNAPNTSAQLDISSTTRGFLPPRMTTTQRNAISSPAAGLVIYNTTDSKLQVYTTSWTDLH